jgi:hypothetical protein
MPPTHPEKANSEPLPDYDPSSAEGDASKTEEQQASSRGKDKKPHNEAKSEQAALKKAAAIKAAILSVGDLLNFEPTGNTWIVHGLLKPGSQMLLAAPPKSGKSLLASEMALALSIGSPTGDPHYLFGATPSADASFEGLRIYPKEPNSLFPDLHFDARWRVLFVSLEMQKTEVAGRLKKQIGKFRLPVGPFPEGELPEALKFPLSHAFGIPTTENTSLKQDLQIIITPKSVSSTGKPTKGPDFYTLRAMIQECRPDVIIYDTLIQLHEINENDNVLMKDLMRKLRVLSVVRTKGADNVEHENFVAHVVLHHTRKENSQFRVPLSPEIMRGAGAVHGVADVVMLARPTDDPKILEVNISSRSSSIPNFFLKRDSQTLTHRMDMEEALKKHVSVKIRKLNAFRETIIAELKNHDPKKGALFTQARVDELMTQAGVNLALPLVVGEKPTQDRFDRLVAEGALEVVKSIKLERGNSARRFFRTTYRVPITKPPAAANPNNPAESNHSGTPENSGKVTASKTLVKPTS